MSGQQRNPDPDDAFRAAAFEAAPIAQIVVDRGGRLAAANLEARVQFGLDQRDVGSLLEDLELSSRPVDLHSQIEQAYAEGQAVILRDVEWHAGIDLRFVDVQVHPLTSRTGELLGAGVSFIDVSRYRRLQDALQVAKKDVETASEELQSTMEELETMNEQLRSTTDELQSTNTVVELSRFFLRFPLGVVGLDAEVRVVFANQRARQLLGGELLRVGHAFPEAPAGGRLRALAGRAARRRVPLRSAVVELEDGRILRVAGVPRRDAEPAVLLFEDVTTEERREKVTREFIRNAAHQLRTPLTAIATAVEALESGAKDDPETLDRFLSHVRLSTQRLTRLARSLLVLARAQSGEHMRLEFVELRPLLELLAREADPAEGVTMRVDCPPALAALAERDLAHEALAALLENAVEHTREGEISLSASEDDGSVAIQVSDTGSGVLPEHRARIAEPFYRTQAGGDGFGLGLAIATQVVEAMGGRFVVDDVERGARFTICLPSARIIR
jgi:signal transduction histidine kinase